MRIVSLDPGATSILCAIGLAEEVAGIADDPVPGDLTLIGEVPFVARARRDPAGSGERRVVVDPEALAAAAPDLVVLPAGLVLPSDAAPGASLVTLDPSSLEGLFHEIATLGAMTTAEDDALALVEELRDRLGAIEERVRERAEDGHPPVRTVALVGLDPLRAGGRWIPEQVRRAGGWDLLGIEGRPATPASWEVILEVDPEALVLLPAGGDLRDVLQAWESLRLPAGWERLAAVDRRQVFAVDPGCFDLAGPRLVEGVALLAELLDPEGFEGMASEGAWAPLLP